MKTYIRLKQHKIRLQNTKQLDQQKYRLGAISNIKLQWGLNRFYRVSREVLLDPEFYGDLVYIFKKHIGRNV